MLRYGCYRYVIGEIFQDSLGIHKRIELPACVVSAIRSKFPSEEYTGFRFVRPRDKDKIHLPEKDE